MHEITDLRAPNLRTPIQVHRLHTPSTTGNIRVISRSESMPNAGGKAVKIRCTSTPSKPIVNRRNTAPVVTSQHLAHRFRQNWLAKFPMDTYSNGAVNLDDSLTSLNWLQNLNIMKMASPSQPPAQQAMTPLTKDSKVNPNVILNVSTTPNMKLDQRLADSTRIISPPVSSYDKIDYKTNHTVKPPYSYATLICMAMQETKKQKITLSAIYNWITDNFMYYRMAEPSWQNSIRHNLSLNKCFQKVPRRKDEPGKGGFWRINPEYVDSFENGVFKKRRCSRDSYTPLPVPPLKKIKREVEDESYTTLQNIVCSKENNTNPFVNFNMVMSDDDSDAFSGDFNWSSILSQDISIDGKTLKTEDLLNETENLASPLMELSPPPSESNSDDLGLEELLSQTDFSQDVALDFTTNDPLDLTVSGTSLKAPDWWGENFTFPDQKELIEAAESATDGTLNNSGLHTPIVQSPAYQNDGLSWDPNELPSAFDVDNLFDIDNIPDPQL